MDAGRETSETGRESPDTGRESPDTGDAPPCPFCGGEQTEMMSVFGSHASLSTCWCADCRSPFEFLRWRDTATGDQGPGPSERNMDPPKRVE